MLYSSALHSDEMLTGRNIESIFLCFGQLFASRRLGSMLSLELSEGRLALIDQLASFSVGQTLQVLRHDTHVI